MNKKITKLIVIYTIALLVMLSLLLLTSSNRDEVLNNNISIEYKNPISYPISYSNSIVIDDSRDENTIVSPTLVITPTPIIRATILPTIIEESVEECLKKGELENCVDFIH